MIHYLNTFFYINHKRLVEELKWTKVSKLPTACRLKIINSNCQQWQIIYSCMQQLKVLFI